MDIEMAYSIVGKIQVPTIILKGQWLKAAVFEAGQYVEVVCEGNKIILSKTTAPEPTTNKSY